MERERGKSKKTIVVLIVVLLILAIGGGVAAFVLLKKPEQNYLTFSYSARGVSATVSVSYQFEGDEQETFLKDSSGNSAYTFTSRPQDNATFSAPIEVALSEGKSYIVFTFSFTNNSDEDLSSEGAIMMATLNDTATKQNVDLMYLVRSSTGATIQDNYTAMIAYGDTRVPNTIFVGPQETVYCQVLVELYGENQGLYTSTKDLGILWTLDVADHYEENGWIISTQNVAVGYSGTESNLIVPSIVTALSDNLFNGNQAITSITIPSTLTAIGEGAFENCTHLTSVVFEDENWALDKTVYGDLAREVVSIGTPAQNAALIRGEGSTVSWSKTTTEGDYVLDVNNTVISYTGTDTTLTLPESATALKNGLFQDNASITGVVFNDKLLSIGKYAFSGCTNLASMTFGADSGLKIIGMNAFENCTSITEFDFPVSASTFGSNIFSGCASLERVLLSQSQISKLSSAFVGCNRLDEIKVPLSSDGYVILNSVEGAQIPTISDKKEWRFESNDYLVSIVLPRDLTIIPNSAFYGCYMLESIDMPNTIVGIGSCAFEYCYHLRSIDIPSMVTMIGGNTFYDCYSLQSVTLPEGLTSIGSNAFYYCLSLRSIDLPDSLTRIGQRAFSGCYSLNSITIPASVAEFGNQVFDSCYALVEVCNKSSCDMGYVQYYSGSSSSNNILVTSQLLNYCTDEAELGALTNQDGIILYQTDIIADEIYVLGYYGDETVVAIPDGVTRVNQYAFYGLSGLGISQDYPDICGPKITDVTIPSSVKAIGKFAFYGLMHLQHVYFADLDNSQLSSVGQYAFSSCPHLLSTTLANGKVGSYSYNYCYSLVDVYSPTGVSGIGTILNLYSDLSSKGTFETTDDGFVLYTYPNSSEVYLVDYIGSSSDIVVPSGVTIVYDNAFRANQIIKSISLPYTVKSVGAYAFISCSNLEFFAVEDTAEHPSSLASIGQNAFYECRNLLSVTIPSSVTSIGSGAFSSCYHLVEVVNDSDMFVESNIGLYLTKGQERGAFSTIDNDWLVYSYGSDVYLVKYSRNNYSSDYTTLPSSITAIANRAFYNGSTSLNFSNIQAYLNLKFCGYESCHPNSLYIAKKRVENLSIPSGVEVIPAYAFSYMSFKSISLPSSLKEIGDYAFYSSFGNSGYATSIKIPSSVEVIGKYAFGGYQSHYLSTVTFGADSNLRVIGEGAFYGQSFTSITIPSSVEEIGAYAFSCSTGSSSYYSRLQTITFESGSQLSFIGAYAFSRCKNMTEITLPSNNIEIGYRAFDGCTSLTKVTTTDINSWLALTFINENSNPLNISNNVVLYFGESQPTTIEIPNGVSEIGDYAFYNCRQITSVTIPSSVKKIGKSSFANCSELSTIIVDIIDTWTNISFADEYSLSISGKTLRVGDSQNPSEVVISNTECISDYAFYNWTGLTSVTIPEGVTSIGKYAFYGCSNLVSITIPSTVTSIGERAFSGCGKLESVTFANGIMLEEIPSNCFYNCSTLVSITIPASVETIGSYAFYNCNKIESITFAASSNLEIIGDYAFRNCTALTSVTFPEQLTTIGSGAFYGCSSLERVVIPASMTSIGGSAFYSCPKLFQVVNKSENIHAVIGNTDNGYLVYYALELSDNEESLSGSLSIENGFMLFSCDDKIYLISYSGEDTQIIVPNTVTDIYASAFYGNTTITSVSIPASVKSIGQKAFYGCSALTSVSLQEGLETIAIEAFRDSGLTSISLPDSVTSVGAYAFYCSKIASVTFSESSNLESIGDHAFKGTFSSVTIPAKVETLGNYAFIGNNLTINFQDTAEHPSHLTTITQSLFHNGIRGITIPSSVTTIEYGAFQNYSSLCNITFVDTASRPSQLKTIGSYAFQKCGIYAYPTVYMNITIPSSVESIGYRAFAECSSLYSFTINGSQDGTSCLGVIGGSVFYQCSRLYSVTLPASLKELGYSAFESCSGLATVTIVDNRPDNPSLLERIGSNAFDLCSNLSSINLPEGLVSIGEWAFYGCTYLRSITIPSTVTNIGRAAFGGCSRLIQVVNKSLKYGQDSTEDKGGLENNAIELIYSGATTGEFVTSGEYVKFLYNDKTYLVGITNSYYSNFVIPDDIDVVGPYALAGLAITSLTIPATVTEIMAGAFSGCTSLATVVFSDDASTPAQITTLAERAFSGCTALSSVTLPSSLTTIGTGTFYNCSALASINLPYGITEIGSSAFQSSKLAAISIPSSVVSIGSSAFASCSSLASVTFEDSTDAPCSLTTIDRYAFQNCTQLTSIEIPSSVVSIGNSAFYGCRALENITIADTQDKPSALTTIGEYAFEYCPFASITLPSSLANIEQYAFYNCSSLTTVTISGAEDKTSHLVTIGREAFERTSITSIVIPSTVTTIGERAFYCCSSLVSVTIVGADDSTSVFGAIDKYVFYGTGIKSITIPASVTSIGEKAFSGCSSLTTVTIVGADDGSSALVTIAGYAFEESGIKSIVIPSGVTAISANAFYNCSSLSSVTLSSTLTTIGKYAFYGCAKLTSINIPASVTYIGEYAFGSCSKLVSIKFASADDWKCFNGIDDSLGVAFDASKLSSASTAAKNLTTTYNYYFWKKM